LELRAAPVWLDRFRAGLEGDAEKAGGRIAQAATDSEDLTRSMTDTSARLRALTTLRDRLQTLLATRSAPLDQLLATERELARVQGELDAARSALNLMSTRVAMSDVTLRYQSEGQFAPDSAFTPVARAAQGSLGAFMGTLGAIIYAFAALLPVLLLLGPLAWLGWRHRRRLKLRKGKAGASSVAVNHDANPTS
jgi:chromosome segregation ATPase